MQATLAELNNQLKVVDELLRDLESKFERGLIDIGRYTLLQKDYLGQRFDIVGRIEAITTNAPTEPHKPVSEKIGWGKITVDPVNLRQSLSEKFDLEEIKDLCFDLNIDFDDLRGEGKKVRELVAYCQRHDRLEELTTRIATLWPGVLQSGADRRE